MTYDIFTSLAHTNTLPFLKILPTFFQKSQNLISLTTTHYFLSKLTHKTHKFTCFIFLLNSLNVLVINVPKHLLTSPHFSVLFHSVLIFEDFISSNIFQFFTKFSSFTHPLTCMNYSLG